MQPGYLDYAATTPMRPEVQEAMSPLLDSAFGNPSSLHRWGRTASAASFISTLEGNSEPLNTPDEALKLMQIIDALYASADSGAPVSL